MKCDNKSTPAYEIYRKSSFSKKKKKMKGKEITILLKILLFARTCRN